MPTGASRIIYLAVCFYNQFNAFIWFFLGSKISLKTQHFSVLDVSI